MRSILLSRSHRKRYTLLIHYGRSSTINLSFKVIVLATVLIFMPVFIQILLQQILKVLRLVPKQLFMLSLFLTSDVIWMQRYVHTESASLAELLSLGVSFLLFNSLIVSALNRRGEDGKVALQASMVASPRIDFFVIVDVFLKLNLVHMCEGRILKEFISCLVHAALIGN